MPPTPLKLQDLENSPKFFIYMALCFVVIQGSETLPTSAPLGAALHLLRDIAIAKKGLFNRNKAAILHKNTKISVRAYF